MKAPASGFFFVNGWNGWKGFIFGIYIKNMFYAVTEKKYFSTILGSKCTDIQIIWNFSAEKWRKLEKNK